MLSQSIIYIASIIGVIGVGLFVAIRSRQQAFKLYGLLSISLSLWLALQFLTDLQLGSGKLWLQIASIALAVAAVSFVLFVYSFPRRGAIPKQQLSLAFAPAVVASLMSFNHWYIEDVTYLDAGIRLTTGPMFIAQSIILGAYFFIGLTLLATQIRHADHQQKDQIYLLTASFGIGILGNLLAGVIFAENPFWQVARPLSILIMLIIIAYAMIYRRLFDIRSYIVRAAGYFVSLSLATVIYVATLVLITTYIVDVEIGTGTMLLFGVVMLGIAVLFQPLHRFFNRITSRLFYRDYYQPQDVLDRLSDLLVRTVDMDQIQEGSSAILQDTIRPTFVKFLLLENSKGSVKRAVEMLMHTEEDILVTDDIGHTEHRDLYKILKKQDVAIAVRLRTSQKDLGFLMLGYRHSGAVYTQADCRLLRVVADEVSFSLQNAMHLNEIEQFNIKLQREIKDATRKLQHSNDHLRMLDQTKDDFISMASHQLRTPLTSIKGYISMVLEGDAGEVTPLQKKLLAQAFVSSQRMVYLISDLLNVSRLRTGKFVIEPTPTHLATIAREEVGQLQETAKSRGIELTVHHTDHFPAVLLDETKMRQVIMNFIDNAIYYTPEGGHIAVNVIERPRSIELTVVDDGMGVPKSDQPHLFTKFFRANNAKRARPDGTGLGLFMAKKVVVAQGGAIIFKSSEGKGSTFGFTFAKDNVTVVKHYKPAQKEPSSLLHKPKSAIMS